jgi:hypothetical protein
MTEPGPELVRPEEEGVPPRMRGLLSRLLRGGFLLALGLLTLGVVGLVSTGIGVGPIGGGAPGTLLDPFAYGLPGMLVFVGLLVLFATPLLRVVLSLGLFAAVGDRAFSTLTLFVLAVLAVTISVGAIR